MITASDVSKKPGAVHGGFVRVPRGTRQPAVRATPSTSPRSLRTKWTANRGGRGGAGGGLGGAGATMACFLPRPLHNHSAGGLASLSRACLSDVVS